MRWLPLTLLLMTTATAAYSAPPATDIQQAVVTGGHGWLNTSRPLTAEDLRGRIVLLDFWTLGCINCMDIIPDLKGLEAEFGNNLTVIGVHSAKFADEKQTDSIRAAVMRYGLAHPVENDSDFTVWNAFGVHAWPTLVLIGPDGKVAGTYAGEGHKPALEKDIKALQKTFKDELVSTPLPITLESAKQPETELLFPGKVMSGNWGSPVKQLPSALFIADSGHNRILVTGYDGTITQNIGSGQPGLKDGDSDVAQFSKPQGLAQLSRANAPVYVADLGNHALREVDNATGDNKITVATLAGTGKQGRFLTDRKLHNALITPMSSPWDVTFWPDEHHLAIAMAGAHQLWSYDIAHKTVSLLAGNGREAIDDGAYPKNALAQPSSLFAAGDKLYFTDAESSSLRVLDKSGKVATLIGKGLFDFGFHDGGRDEARLQHPLGITGDKDNLYIADTYNHSVRIYDLKTRKLNDYGGHGERGQKDGTLAQASFNEPGGITIYGNMLYVADTNNNALRAINIAKGTVSAVDVHSASAPANKEFTDTLPNLQTLSSFVTSQKPIKVALELKPGWHINETAPSKLSLYNEADKGKALAGFSRDELRQGPVMLPKLDGGLTYRLRGTLYYCADAAGSLCMIKSFDVTLTPNGGEPKITLPVY